VQISTAGMFSSIIARLNQFNRVGAVSREKLS
jgi:hypothetical protein